MKHRLTWTLAFAAANLSVTGTAAAQSADATPPNPSASLPSDMAVTAAAGAEFATYATLDQAASDDGSGDLEVSFTPYLWMPSIKGDVAIPRSEDEADIDRSFSDLLSDLKFAFMGTLDANYHRFIMHTDLIYLSIGAGVERVDSPIFTEGEVDAKIVVATGALGYRVIDRGPMYVDIYAGGRLVSLDLDLSLEGPLQTREASASPSNISPLVGGKARFPLSERWALALQGDLGFDSDVKWQLAGTVQYQLGNHWLAGVGYRHLSLHHDSDEAEFDIAFSGPLLAFTYIF